MKKGAASLIETQLPFIDYYEMTLVKGEIACQKQIFEQGHVRRAETIRIPALATLLYVDWLPQVNGSCLELYRLTAWITNIVPSKRQIVDS